MTVTIHDVAREAGVSLATVDRVLNDRPGVRDRTIDRVLMAVRKLGYVRNAAAATLARAKPYRLRFLLPDSDNTFLRGLKDEIEAVFDTPLMMPVEPTVDLYASFDHGALTQKLVSMDPTFIDGLALVATDAPEVRTAVNRLVDAGIEVITLVSDLPSSRRSLFVGIDNLAAGRSAGALMSRFLGDRRGKVCVLSGSQRVRDHAERRLGFEQALKDAASNVTLTVDLEGFDDPTRTEDLLTELLATEPELVGLYNAGAGNRGMISALTASGRATDITVIGHELTPVTRPALRDGTIDAVIHQDLGHEARSAVRLLMGRVGGGRINWRQEAIRIEIFIKENLP